MPAARPQRRPRGIAFCASSIILANRRHRRSQPITHRPVDESGASAMIDRSRRCSRSNALTSLSTIRSSAPGVFHKDRKLRDEQGGFVTGRLITALARARRAST